MVLFSLLSGTVLAAAQGSLLISELALLHSLAAQLAAGDILVGDRGFGSFPVIVWLKVVRQVDFLGRTTRRIDGRRRLRPLGPNDWLLLWKASSSCTSPWLGALVQALLPSQITLRAVKGSCYQKGFRVRQVTVVTTLLDPERYPAREILQAYLRRWRLEMCLDDLKTSLQMESLRGRTPATLQRELYTRLIAHNLIRCTMAQAASDHHVPLEQLSFKGSLDAVRHFCSRDDPGPFPRPAPAPVDTAAPNLSPGPGPRTAQPTRAARGQTEEKQVPTPGCSTPQIPRSSQTP